MFLGLKVLIRTITTFTGKHPSIITTASSLHLDTYCKPNFQDIYTKNRAIDTLIKHGQLNSAVKIFNKMAVHDVITYNLLISAYNKHGLFTNSFSLYKEMVFKGIKENPSTFSTLLSICSDVRLFETGVQVHCRVVKLGLESNLYIGSSLVGLYVNSGFDGVALKLFDELPERSLATWNVVIQGFVKLGRCVELLWLFGRMRVEGVEPNGLSFCYLVKGCGAGRFVDEGRQLHCMVVKSGWVQSNLFVANALVDFYSACGSLVDAVKSFEGIPEEDVISWNSLVSVYAAHNLLSDALELFARMQYLGRRPSIRSIVGLLNLASRIRNYWLGKQCHCGAVKSGFDDGSVRVQSALIDMYGKCGDIESSVTVYNKLPKRTLECCNSLMASFLHCGIVEDVVEMFGLMVDEGIGFDEITLSSSLKALSVSALTSFTTCSLLHNFAIKLGYESDIAVSCSLINAYARCGNLNLSCQVFKKLPSPNVYCYTSLINGYAWNGKGKECLQILQRMIQNGLAPDKVTFLCVLTGCSHAGLVQEGKMIFKWMRNAYGIYPDQQHYSCLVDLLGRAGLLDEAEELLLQAPRQGDPVMWGSLLRSCSIHKNEILGRKVAKNLMDLDPDDPAICLQVSNFYSETGDFETSVQIREIALAKKAARGIGHSLIELNERF